MRHILNLFAVTLIAAGLGACNGHMPRVINMSAGEPIYHDEDEPIMVSRRVQVQTRPDMDEVYAARALPVVDIIHHGELIGRGDLTDPDMVGMSNFVYRRVQGTSAFTVRCPNGSTTVGRVATRDEQYAVRGGATMLRLDRSCLLPHNVVPPPEPSLMGGARSR